MTTSGGIGGLPPVGAGVCATDADGTPCAITHSTTGWCLQATGEPVVVITRWPCEPLNAPPQVTMLNPSTGAVVPTQVVVPCDGKDWEVNQLCDIDATGELLATVTQIFEWDEASGSLVVRLVRADDPTGPDYVVVGTLQACASPTWLDAETALVCGNTAGTLRQLTQMVVYDVRNGLVLNDFYLDAAGAVVALNVGETVTVGDCWTMVLPSILDELEQSNGTLTDLAACCAAQTVLLTDIDANTDGIEPLLVQIRDNADAVEALLAAIGANTDNIEPLLTTGNANTAPLAGLLTTIRDNADAVESLLAAIGANTDGLEACCASTNAQLVTLNAAVDTVEALLTSIEADTSSLVTLTTVGNATLVSIAGFVDALEGQNATIIGHVDGIEGLLTAMTGQLTTIIGHVDGIEGLLTSGNTLATTANTLLTTIASVVRAEDSAHASGQAGTFILGVRNDNDVVVTSADGDYSQVSVDSAGRLKTTSTAVSTPATSGGLSVYRNLDVNATGQVVKASAGQLYQIHATNRSNSEAFLKIYNKATAPVAADVPVMTIPIGAANGNGFNTAIIEISVGIAFSLGIGVRGTNGLADGDNANPGVNAIVLNMGFK